jgi:hypothetical protein
LGFNLTFDKNAVYAYLSSYDLSHFNKGGVRMELLKKLLAFSLLAALMLSIPMLGKLSVNLIGNALFPSPDAKAEKLAEKLSELDSELRQIEEMSETKGWCGFYGKRYEDIVIQWIFGSGRLYEEYNSRNSERNELVNELEKLQPHERWSRRLDILADCTPEEMRESYNPNKKRDEWPPPHRGSDTWPW